MVLDLRYNGGGLVSVAELLGDLMLAELGRNELPQQQIAGYVGKAPEYAKAAKYVRSLDMLPLGRVGVCRARGFL